MEHIHRDKILRIMNKSLDGDILKILSNVKDKDLVKYFLKEIKKVHNRKLEKSEENVIKFHKIFDSYYGNYD